MANIPVSENVANKLKEIAAKMGGGQVQVGFLEGETYPDGTPVAQVAYWNEFGHAGPFPAPPRPFFRPMVAKESPTWGAKMASAAKSTDYDGAKVLALMGEDIAGALTDSIRTAEVAPLSATTLMLRATFGNQPQNIRARDVIQAQQDVKDGKQGASGTQAKPLDWTGQLLRSPEYKVVRNGS